MNAMALAWSLKAALLLATLAAAGGQASGGEQGLRYIVPAAAGSADGPAARVPLPANLTFADGSSISTSLGHFRGMVVLLTFWSSRCGPCLKQMVYLDRLQGDLKGQPLAVIAATEDEGGIAAAKAYLVREKLTFLRPFADPGGGLARALQVRGLPTSLIIDKYGRLVQQVTGPYEWDNPKILAVFRALLAEH